jgi:DNA repair exonuclease SbcCD ATPase subunit
MTRRLKSVQIKNIKGIESLAFETGAVTILRGRNGAGKTSVVDALLAVFEGGHDPDLIRRGTKEGSVLLSLDDGVTIKKTIKPERSTLEVRTADSGKVNAEATYVKKLTSGLRFNPAAFISMSGRERAAELAKAMPVQFQGTEVNAAANEAILADQEVIDQRRLDEIRNGRYASRTDVRREQDAAEGFIIETERNLPTGTPASWAGVVEMLRVQVGDAKAALEKELAEVERKAIGVVNGMRDTLDENLAVLKKQYDEAVATLNWNYNSGQAEVVKSMEAEKHDLRASAAAQLEDLTQSLGQAEASLAEQNRVEGQRAQLEKMRVSAQKLNKRWNQLDTAVKGLDRLKSEKLATLPIPGIEVRLDEKNMPEVYIDNVPWPHVNKSMQCKVAITIAAQALGELPLMVLDESEVLDAENMMLLTASAKDLGMQIILARVESGAELQAVEA